MFIKLSTKELKKTLYNLLLTTSKDKSSILNSIFIEINKNKLFLSSTNLITKYQTEIKLIESNTEQLTLCLNAEKLHSIIQQIAEEYTQLQITDRTINIISSDFKAQLKKEDETLYPKPTIEEEREIAKIKSETLKKLISSVAFSSGKNSINQEYNGIFFKLTKDGIVAAATNGYRLGEVKKVKLDNEEEIEEAQFLVDIDGALLLQRLLKDEKVIISVTDKNTYFDFNNEKVQIRLTQATFPDYSSIMPEVREDILIKTRELENAIRAVIVIDPKGFINISSNNKEKLKFISNNEEGEVAEYVLNKVKINNNIQFTLNGKYILDFLKLVQSEYIIITLNNKTSPILLSSTEEPYYYKYIVVPIND
ncbi:MAG: DNA polymerase III subunit beta [Deltaproteobacteria bacterium]|nr:DNA polymerase III subunit beta [Deltaproteobacteria bacterium]